MGAAVAGDCTRAAHHPAGALKLSPSLHAGFTDYPFLEDTPEGKVFLGGSS